MELHHLRRRQQGIDHIPMVRAVPAPLKRSNVLCNRHVVKFNCAHQCFVAQRHPAFLPGIAQQHWVDKDRVAQDLGGHAVGIEGTQTF